MSYIAERRGLNGLLLVLKLDHLVQRLCPTERFVKPEDLRMDYLSNLSDTTPSLAIWDRTYVGGNEVEERATVLVSTRRSRTILGQRSTHLTNHDNLPRTA